MNTILSEQSLKDILVYYENNKHFKFIVKPSLPILFFGDLQSYSQEPFKVLTVGLNPSNSEFRLNQSDEYSYIRFPEYKGDLSTLELTLSNYFKNKPYDRWFNSFEPYLNGLGYSFYPKNPYKKVIHTDIGSPFPTYPTWSRLEYDERNMLFKKGLDIWRRLIHEVKPNLIVISTRYEYVDYLKPQLIQTLYSVNYKLDGSLRRPFNLKLFKVDIDGFKTYLIYGEPKHTPFGSVSTEDKITMGKITKKYFETENLL